MVTRRSAFAAALAVAIGIGCGDHSIDPVGQPPPSSANAVLVSLTSPNGDDGAILVTLKGPDIAVFESAFRRTVSTRDS